MGNDNGMGHQTVRFLYHQTFGFKIPHPLLGWISSSLKDGQANATKMHCLLKIGSPFLHLNLSSLVLF